MTSDDRRGRRKKMIEDMLGRFDDDKPTGHAPKARKMTPAKTTESGGKALDDLANAIVKASRKKPSRTPLFGGKKA